MTVDELLARARRRGFLILGREALVDWLHELAAAGVAVEIEPDRWELTPAGRKRFAVVAQLEPKGATS